MTGILFLNILATEQFVNNYFIIQYISTNGAALEKKDILVKLQNSLSISYYTTYIYKLSQLGGKKKEINES